MFIELIERFRCVRDHPESWLVAIIDEANGRLVIRGALGCPECGSEYAVTDGVLDMRSGATPPPPAAAPVDHWRIAALLDLGPAVHTVVLHGAAAAARDQILEVFAGNVVAVNPPQQLAPRERSAVVLTGNQLPLRTASVSAVAITVGDHAFVAESARVLGPGGRLLAPKDALVPAGMILLASDEREWLAQTEMSSAPLQLTRR